MRQAQGCDARVLAWLAQRRAAGEEAGASEAEIADRWACLHVASQYIDDESTVSIDDLIFDAAGAPVMREGAQLTRATLHFEAVKRVLGSYKGVDTSALFTRQCIVADVLYLRQEVTRLHLALPKGVCPDLIEFAKSLDVSG